MDLPVGHGRPALAVVIGIAAMTSTGGRTMRFALHDHQGRARCSLRHSSTPDTRDRC